MVSIILLMILAFTMATKMVILRLMIHQGPITKKPGYKREISARPIS